MREARATAKIGHDHIVTIFQVGEDRGVPFLAMQLLEGMSLEDFLKKHTHMPFSVEQILKLGREIARGLGEVYPGHKEKGFPPDKLGEHLANLERLGAVKFNGEKWAASDVGVKMVKKYFG